MDESTKPHLSGSTAATRSGSQQSPAKPEADAALAAPKQKGVIPPNRQTPIYSLPLPIRTFPLPALNPGSLVSLVHLAVAWLGQVVWARPVPEPAVVYEGVWSAATRSVHVTDRDAMQALWWHGFFGKGSLSRSEPIWLTREQIRMGLVGETSEQRTARRREERAETKWERGRNELEAIEERRQHEAAAAAAAAEASHVAIADKTRAATVNGTSTSARSPRTPPKRSTKDVKRIFDYKAPVGPLELLALPNSEADLVQSINARPSFKAPVGPLELLALPNTDVNTALFLDVLKGGGLDQAPNITGIDVPNQNQLEQVGPSVDARPNAAASLAASAVAVATQQEMSIDSMQDDISSFYMTGNAEPAGEHSGIVSATVVYGEPADTDVQPLKLQKSVRFSPTVESTTYQCSDPPCHNHCSDALPHRQANGKANGKARNKPTALDVSVLAATIQNKEHLQLSAEEAFFLVYALGVLVVRDPAAGDAQLSTERLFRLFRQHSYFPARTAEEPLAPDDPFLVQYAVYHHFRALGWVPRHGIKFGVDWLLYGKGPALDHAEFGVMVVPSYMDLWWQQQQQQQQLRVPRKSWPWLHSVNRVLTTVYKSMVLVYVDIPAPAAEEPENITALLGRFRIREILVRRWSSNRNRD